MSETFIQVPPNSSGSKYRTIEASIGGNTIEMDVIMIADSGSNATMTPAKTQQFPTALTAGGSLKVAINEVLSGSSQLTGSTITLSVTGSLSSAGQVAITGSTATLAVTGSVTISPVMSGSGVYTYASAMMVTGSININNAAYAQNVSGSGIYTYASATMITGSVCFNPSAPGIPVSGSGIYTYASAHMVTGSVNINGPPSICVTGSGGLISSGSLVGVTLVAGFGKLIITGSTGRIKVYDCGFSIPSEAYACFYFGLSGSGGTTGSNSMFSVFSGSGTIQKSYFQPRVGPATYSLWLYSTAAQAFAPVDVGYLIEA